MDESLVSQGPQTGNSDATWIFTGLQRSFTAIKRVVLAHRAEALCTCLLLLLAVNLLAAISRKSITNDEVVHIPAGYYHLVAGDFQLNNEHPPLVKIWAALPLLFIQPDEPKLPEEGSANFAEKTWAFHQLFWNGNQDRFGTIGYWSRLMMIPVTMSLGLVIFLFSRRLFGARAALLAVALFIVEPTILAHGRIVHTDVPAALVYILFFFAAYLYLNEPTWKRVIFLAVATSVALLTKFSMVILAPMLLAYATWGLWLARRDIPKRTQLLKHAALVTLIVIIAINAAYYFRHEPISSSDQQWLQSNSGPTAPTIGKAIDLASYIVPTYYLFGIYNVGLHNKAGHATSLMGNYGQLGWWYYFPTAFALKTSLPFLLIAVASLAWAIWELVRKRRVQLLWLFVPLLLYSAVSLTGHINIGIRHFLPVFPILFILGGAFLDRLLEQRIRVVGLALVVVLVGWTVVEAARTFPDYTPYMNQLASGHPHWWYLSDSNVEWGDDVGELARYLHSKGETKVRAALSGGWSTLPRYGIEFISIVPPDPDKRTSRYVAIGASYLNGSVVPFPDDMKLTDEQRVNFFDDYRRRTPEAVFGGSIYLFREQ
jgi:4-amino-4-deoxy-L-arabinose transferase-like glycosyltransferase